MKIAISFKYNFEDYEIALKKKNFNIGNSSYSNTLWVYDLKTISELVAPKDYISNLQLVKKDLDYYNISFKDIEYFEIHNE